MFSYLFLCWEALIVCIWLCVCVCEWDVSHVSLVLKCGAHSVWLNNEFSRLRTEEPTLLITQINKHADEQQQWNNGNTTGSVSSVAGRKDNYSYPPTPSLPFKHTLHHLFSSLLFSHLPLCLFITPALSRIYFIFLHISVVSFFLCVFVFVMVSLTFVNFLRLVIR